MFHHGPESDTTNGSLESLPHNVIHGAIGGVAPGGNPNDWRDFGLMSMPMTAALDPIFWLHHANIDRLWSVWLRDAQEQHENPDLTTWLDGPADRQFVFPTSNQGERTFRARDVLDTTAAPLDYRYEDETPPVVERRAVRRRDQAWRASRRRRRQGKRGAPVSTENTPELIGASDGEVRVAGATGAAVRLDPSANTVPAQQPGARGVSRRKVERRTGSRLPQARGHPRHQRRGDLSRLHRPSAKRRPGRTCRPAGRNRVPVRDLGRQRS